MNWFRRITAKQGSYLDSWAREVVTSIIGWLKEQKKATIINVPFAKIISPSEALTNHYINSTVLKLELSLINKDSPEDFYINGLFHDAGRYLEITIFIKVKSLPIDGRLLSGIYEHLSNTLRHEMHHPEQAQKDPNLLRGGYSKGGDSNNWKSENALEWTREYLTNPSEIEAHVVGAYYQAKKMKKPFTQVINDEINTIIGYLKRNNVDDASIQQLKNEIYALWNAYAAKRYPKTKEVTNINESNT